MYAPPLDVLERIDSLLNDHGLNEISTVIETVKKEKSRINAQLKLESDNRLKDFDSMMLKMKDTSSQLQELKLNVSKLDELQKDNSNDNQNNFNIFDEAMIVMNNVSSVEKMIDQMNSFERDIKYVGQLIEMEFKLIDSDLNDDGDRFIQSSGDNFLIAHYQLNKLLDFNDKLKEQKSKLPQTDQMINKITNDLKNVSGKFDQLLEHIVDSVYEFYLIGNFQYLIKTSKVIEYEEKEDLKVRIWKNLMNDESTHNFKINRLEERGYKTKFRDLIKVTIQDKISTLKADEKDPYKACQIVVNKMLPADPNDPIANSYYDILTVYREAARQCAPAQWKLFSNVLIWCQMVIRDIILDALDSKVYTDDLIGKIIHLNLDNKNRLMKMSIPNSIVKSVSLLPEDRKRVILNDRLSIRMNDLQQHINNLLKRDMKNFQELCSNGVSSDELGLNVAAPIINLLKSHFGLINQLHDESITIEFLNYFGNEILKFYCTSWSNLTMDSYQKFISGEGNLSYFPEQLSNLSVYFSKLADELELMFEITNLSGGGFELMNLGFVFNLEGSRVKIDEICEICIKSSIDITVECLSIYAQVTIHDVDMLFDELFKSEWYSDHSLIDKILKLVSENSFEPFKEVVRNHSNVPDEVMHGLLDKFVDEFILRYLDSLNNRNKVLSGIDKAIGRDLGKINGFLQYYGGGEDDESIKLLILEYVQTLMVNDNYEQMWVEIIDSIPNMPIDLLRIILECKKEKNIESTVKLCENITTVNATNKSFEFLKRFTYKGRGNNGKK